MSGLSIVILTEDAERFRGTLALALAYVALGNEARLFLQLDAVRLLVPPVTGPRDEDHRAAGLPSLATLLEEALDTGVKIIACQSGMTLASLDATDLDPRISAGGPISVLQSMEASSRLLSV
jgi:predicted peroxiredoxin